MPAAVTAIRKVPWKRVWISALWLFKKGRARLEANLTVKEREEFWGLIRGAKGNPANLSNRQRERVRDLVGKAARGG